MVMMAVDVTLIIPNTRCTPWMHVYTRPTACHTPIHKGRMLPKHDAPVLSRMCLYEHEVVLQSSDVRMNMDGARRALRMKFGLTPLTLPSSSNTPFCTSLNPNLSYNAFLPSNTLMQRELWTARKGRGRGLTRCGADGDVEAVSARVL